MRAYWLIVVLVGCVCARAPKENERISVQKCKEYGQNVIKPCINGNENESELAVPKEFPHMALIGHGTEDDIEWICSGSLISDQYVISAAHCAASVPIKGRPKWIRLGELDLTSTTDDAQVQDFNISEIILHPNYNRPGIYHDIVVFKLDQPVVFSDYIRPACLTSGQKEVDAVDKFTVSGWGEEQGAAHKHLKQDKNITKVTNEECNKAYENIVGSRRLNGGVMDTQLCATTAQTQACHIKSGAPLQYHNKEVECMYNIAGINSAGLSFCGPAPGIYTNVPSYLDWIEGVVWSQTST